METMSSSRPSDAPKTATAVGSREHRLRATPGVSRSTEQPLPGLVNKVTNHQRRPAQSARPGELLDLRGEHVVHTEGVTRRPVWRWASPFPSNWTPPKKSPRRIPTTAMKAAHNPMTADLIYTCQADPADHNSASFAGTSGTRADEHPPAFRRASSTVRRHHQRRRDRCWASCR